MFGIERRHAGRYGAAWSQRLRAYGRCHLSRSKKEWTGDSIPGRLHTRRRPPDSWSAPGDARCICSSPAIGLHPRLALWKRSTVDSFVSTCAGLCPRTLHRVPLSTPTEGTHGSRGLSEEQAQESEVGRLTTHANQRLIDERPCHLPSGRHHDAGVRRATCMQVHVCLQIRAHVQANKPGGSHISAHDANVEEIDGTTARIAAAPCSSVLQTTLFFLSPGAGAAVFVLCASAA